MRLDSFRVGYDPGAASHACRFGYIVSLVFEVKEEFRLKMDGPNIGPIVGGDPLKCHKNFGHTCTERIGKTVIGLDYVFSWLIFSICP